VDADVQPPIINDHEHQDFFIAILKGGSAIPKIEPEELAEWRNYVLHGGGVPQWRQAAATRSSTLAPDGKRENNLMSWMSHAVARYVSAGARYSATAHKRRSRSGRSSTYASLTRRG
jgi:hypothetical protein